MSTPCCTWEDSTENHLFELLSEGMEFIENWIKDDKGLQSLLCPCFQEVSRLKCAFSGLFVSFQARPLHWNSETTNWPLQLLWSHRCKVSRTQTCEVLWDTQLSIIWQRSEPRTDRFMFSGDRSERSSACWFSSQTLRLAQTQSFQATLYLPDEEIEAEHMFQAVSDCHVKFVCQVLSRSQ